MNTSTKIDQSKDVYVCADCGREFADGNERDDHFMSSDCKWVGRYDEEGCEAHKSNKIARKIAVQFAVNLDADGIDLAKVDRVNKTPEYKGSSICASHDQCDANMYMLPAFESVTGHDMDCGSDYDAHLWGKAWDIAKKQGFVKLAKEGAAA